ncbi:MAG: hypothetical protein LAO05_08160 [Acidobacteriia bacterium]|nr:hypothetical protein [Terriglobia bacterium]
MRRPAVALFLIVLCARAFEAGDTALLPSSESLGGWKPAAPARVFTGSALYGHIDGGAEIFLEFGFEELTVQRYADGPRSIDVELYRMTDPTAALGIYLERCGNRCEAPAAHRGFPTYTSLGRSQLMAAQDRFLVILTANASDPQTTVALSTLASDVVRCLPTGPAPDPGKRLPPGWVAGSLRVIRGPLALQAIITLGDADVLQLRGSRTAVAADYAAAPGQATCTMVLADYPDQAAASSAFAHLRGNLDPEIKVLGEGQESFVFRDYSGKFGSAVAIGGRITLRLNLASEPPRTVR